MPLHPQAQQFMDMLVAQEAPAWSEMSPAEAREVFRGMEPIFGNGPKLPRVEDREVADRFPVRLYDPGGDQPRAALLYLHGGGWVLGDLDTHDALCRRLAARSGRVVIAVGYRPAPEAQHPAPIDDGYEALRFVHDHADELAIDSQRIAIAGDSVGGHMAASVSLRARDAGGPNIERQLLIYPVVGPNFETESYRQFADDYGLTRDSMIWFWQQYLGDQFNSDAPGIDLSRERLDGLPPTHLVTAEFDVLRSEGEAFADLLEQAGVAVTRQRYAGMLHGFVHFAGFFDVGKEAALEFADRLRQPAP